MAEDLADFDDFVAARSRPLLKAAWLLTGDWQRAEDLLQTALAKAYLRWHRIQPGRQEAYVRRILVTTYATWWRRAWKSELPSAELPEAATDPDAFDAVELRRELRQALSGLSGRQRATVVLRFYFDLSEAETAATLQCSVGTVKSQTARALTRLRESNVLRDVREGTNPD